MEEMGSADQSEGTGGDGNGGSDARRTLVIIYSYHHKNTEKIAKVIATVLGAEIRTPQHLDPEELQEYDFIGFGSGIYGGKHHETLLELAEKLQHVTNRKAFLFSTSAIMGENKVASDHSTLRGKLLSKGYDVIDEFACKGFNTNSFLKYFGGMNRGRPNAEDLEQAKEFAQNLKERVDSS